MNLSSKNYLYPNAALTNAVWATGHTYSGGLVKIHGDTAVVDNHQPSFRQLIKMIVHLVQICNSSKRSSILT